MAATTPKSARRTTAAKLGKPNKLTIRSYQVGFGDCFLLTFGYPNASRHVLIDFGSTGKPKRGTPKNLMDAVAADIAAQCGGKLHAVVATHRHQDHISGFATRDDGKGTGDVIRGLKPDLVVQPWTEDPKAEEDATKATAKRAGSNALVRSLVEMRGFAGHVLKEVERRRKLRELGRDLADEIEFLGQDGLSNLSAVKNLMTMGKRREYLSYGDPTGLEGLLPGVRVSVLGPPTIEQSPRVESQRAKDAAEFWHFQAAAARRAAAATPAAKALFPLAKRHPDGGPLPPYARWFAPRLREIRGEQLLQIVRAMDDALNNTSVILLFEAGGKRFLFPGDAQIENWSYALNHAKDHKNVRARLADVDFYKVGHHGSLNATPKTLWGLFKKKSPKKTTPDRLCTAVSTLGGKHGKVRSGTEVPRAPLIKELQRQSTFFCTEDLIGEKDPAKRLRHNIVFNLSP